MNYDPRELMSQTSQVARDSLDIQIDQIPRIISILHNSHRQLDMMEKLSGDMQSSMLLSRCKKE